MPAQISLPAFVDVVVLVNRRIVAKQNEFVSMAAESKIKFSFASQVLLQPDKPGFRPLPGIVGSVELVGPERLVAVSQHQQRAAQCGLGAGDREKSQAAVVA